MMSASRLSLAAQRPFRRLAEKSVPREDLFGGWVEDVSGRSTANSSRIAPCNRYDFFQIVIRHDLASAESAERVSPGHLQETRQRIIPFRVDHSQGIV